jgi:TonB family protein
MPEDAPERKSVVFPVAVGIAILALAAAGVYWFAGRSNSDEPVAGSATASGPATDASQSNPAAASIPPHSGETATAPAAADSARPPAPTPAPPTRSSATHSGLAASESDSSPGAGVVHEEIPKVSPRSRATIHGHVKVAVRVTVDKSGTVTSDVLEITGPSKYFSRMAGEAASKWKFVPAASPAPRQWVLRFEFSRDGTTVHAAPRN